MFGFPDVCNTPVGPSTAPVPYPNFAFSCMAFPFSPIVRTTYVNTLNQASMIPMSTGDEGGVAHPFFKSVGRFIMGCIRVFVDKLPAIHLTNPTSQNNSNQTLGSTLIPSATNVFMNERAPSDSAGDDGTFASRMLTERTGYIRVGRIDRGAATRLQRALRDMPSAIIDLRGNPGGELDAARRIGEELLPREVIFTRQRDVDGDETVMRIRHEGDGETRLWLLVDGMTASAAEVLAAALKHHRRARLIGETTYGKGRCQLSRAIPGGIVNGVAFVCGAPDRAPIEEHGVSPDISVQGPAALAVALIESEATWLKS